MNDIEEKAQEFLRCRRGKILTWYNIEAMALFAKHYHEEQINELVYKLEGLIDMEKEHLLYVKGVNTGIINAIEEVKKLIKR